MQFLRETNIDFMKYRKFWIVVSLALVALGFFMIFAHGRLNVGIDFAGGTQITARFQQRPDIDRLRQIVAAAGVGESQIQRFGDADANEVMIRTPLAPGTEEGSGPRVLAALRQEYGEGFQVLAQENVGPRSEERRVGKECRSRGAPDQ